MSHNLASRQIELLTELRRSGATIREIARGIGAATNTVKRHLGLLGLNDIGCPCGLPITHRVMCSERFARSPSRQKIIAAWHGRVPVDCDTTFVGAPHD